MDDSSVDLAGFNPFDPAIQQCPHQYYRAMQAGPAVFHVPGTDLYLVTRHDLVVPILRDTATFSSRFGGTGEMPTGEVLAKVREIMAGGYPQVPTMLTIDPPDHTRFRGTVAPYFTPKRLADLRQPVEQICERLIDGWIGEGSIEFVSRFAVPLPVEVIARVLNVPGEEMANFKRWSDDSIATIGANPPPERRLEAARGVVELQHFLAAQLEARRSEPRGDLLSDLVQATIPTDDGGTRPLTMAEMISIVQQLLVAGNETTTKSLTEAMVLLARSPEQWRALQVEPERAPMVVEEVLRLSTPTQGMFRLVTRATEIDGVAVPAGARVVVVYSAANRDPSVFGDPDAFDPDRPNLKEHLAFGKGIHFCLGAPLSRLELSCALVALSRRLGHLELPETNTFQYHPSFMLRGLTRLDLAFSAR